MAADSILSVNTGTLDFGIAAFWASKNESAAARAATPPSFVPLAAACFATSPVLPRSPRGAEKSGFTEPRTDPSLAEADSSAVNAESPNLSALPLLIGLATRPVFPRSPRGAVKSGVTVPRTEPSLAAAASSAVKAASPNANRASLEAEREGFATRPVLPRSPSGGVKSGVTVPRTEPSFEAGEALERNAASPNASFAAARWRGVATSPVSPRSPRGAEKSGRFPSRTAPSLEAAEASGVKAASPNLSAAAASWEVVALRPTLAMRLGTAAVWGRTPARTLPSRASSGRDARKRPSPKASSALPADEPTRATGLPPP
mmetsp:Transcript_64198/g.147098  ORF Transcript_64198/g.147098 Transcript_64198/m.147098 type:complete len:317 (-) Transcript_64198:145-1095(-)